MSADSSSPAPPSHASHVIVCNVGKKHNVGTICRCCTAFGVTSLCLVGENRYNTFGSHGSDVYVAKRHFPTVEACCGQLREEGCEIVGIEIMAGALPVHSHPFTRSTAFMLGNEGQGLSRRQREACSKFVYIPQHGVGTASLNVAVAASIVLHHFALWANYSEQDIEGEKFVVAPRPLKTAPRGVLEACKPCDSKDDGPPLTPDGDDFECSLFE